MQDAEAFDRDLDGGVDPNRISGVRMTAPADTVPGPSSAIGAAPRTTRGGRSLPAAQ